jgi:hypothetical protein
MLATLGLGACATDPFGPLAQSLLKPREATISSGAQEVSRRSEQTEESCSEITQMVLTDVDTAYARVMQRLRFRTLEERKRFAEHYSTGLIDEGFRHTAQPTTGWQTSWDGRMLDKHAKPHGSKSS